MQNVTPRIPGSPGMPGAQKPRFSLRQIIIVVAIVLVVLLVINKFVIRHETHAEHLATVVTEALAANNMAPVESQFNALRRPELENRARVGRLSDFVNAKGAFKNVSEDTPAGSPALYHHFIAHFANGDLQERLELDDDGKIAKFDVRSLGAQSETQQ
jgi:hypothetical protein